MANLKVLSLNMMHGRDSDSSAFPVFFPKEKIVSNLDHIASLLRQQDADIVCLQEVDLFSVTAGKIDQLEYLRDKTGYAYAAYGLQSGIVFGTKTIRSSGCGTLSRYPITNSVAIKFSLSFPAPRKGFLVSKIKVGNREITVVSVHLAWIDWLRFFSKKKQVALMMDTLKGNQNLVVAGDFNISMCDAESSSITALMSELKLTTCDLNSAGLFTFPAYGLKKRIDWIFTSASLPIVEYSTIPERVSDHLAITATLQV